MIPNRYRINIDDPIQYSEVLLDPASFSSDGTASLGKTSFSEDGLLVAYSIKQGGSDWETIKIRKVLSREDLDDQLSWVKFSTPSWTKDNKGFFYSRYEKPQVDARSVLPKAGPATQKLQN